MHAASEAADRGTRVLRDELVLRAMAADRDAFTQLAAASIDRLYSIARLILRADDRAEDAVQEALLQAWLNLRGLRDPSRFDAWLNRLTVHACYAAARRRREPVQLSLDDMAPSPPDGGLFDIQRTVADRDQIDRAFARLSPEHRAALVAHHYLDLPDAEAAELLRVRVGTLKSRLHRAHRALRDIVAQDDVEPGLQERRLA